MRIPIHYTTAPVAPDARRPADHLRLIRPVGGPSGDAADPEPDPPSRRSSRESESSAEPAGAGGRTVERQLQRALAEKRELQADFDNYRRHAEARLARAAEDAAHDVLAELGDALRSLEIAAHASQDGDEGPGETDPEPRREALRTGIVLVVRGLEAVFERHGLERIPAEGQAFDPRVHEAVLVESRADVTRGTVVRELSPGFRTADRVVRPARVAVAG